MTPAPATLAAELFRGLSRWRGRRAFHPYGVGFAAELERLDGGAVLPAEIDGEAIVRLSRSIGAPEWLPDPCGLALRVPDAYGPGCYQDLLLASSGQAPLARHCCWPSAAGGFDGALGFRPLQQQRWRPGARGLAQQAAGAELRRQSGGARRG